MIFLNQFPSSKRSTAIAMQLRTTNWQTRNGLPLPRARRFEYMVNPTLLRSDDFFLYVTDRATRILDRIEKVVRKAVPSVIEIAKQMIWQFYQLPTKGNKIIIAK